MAKQIIEILEKTTQDIKCIFAIEGFINLVLGAAKFQLFQRDQRPEKGQTAKTDEEITDILVNFIEHLLEDPNEKTKIATKVLQGMEAQESTDKAWEIAKNALKKI